MGTPGLLVALDYIVLLSELKPEKARIAALRWHGRLELEARSMSLEESRLALNALEMLIASLAQFSCGPRPCRPSPGAY